MRRAIVRDVAASDASSTISDLVQQMTERQDGSADWDDHAFRIRLHHQHLPKMVDSGVLEYDSNDERVTLTSVGEDVEAVRKQIVKVFEMTHS